MHGSVVGHSTLSVSIVWPAFALIIDCSALLWLLRIRDLDPTPYRWAFRLTEFDMEMKWSARLSHQLSDTLFRLLRPNAAPEFAVNSFPDDCTSGNPLDYGGPRGLVLEGQLLNDLNSLKEGTTDPGGTREKDAVRGVDQTVSRRPKLRPMLNVVINSIPRADASHTDLEAQNGEVSSDARLAALPFHDQVAAIGADRPVVLPRRSGRVRGRLVRLTPLVRPPCAPSYIDAHREGTGATRAQTACLECEVNHHRSSGRSTSRDRGRA